MNKIQITIFALVIAYAYGACQTDLANHFGLTGLGSTAAGGSGLGAGNLQSCISLGASTSQCCTLDDINTKFKAKSTSRAGDIDTANTARDKKFLTARNELGAQLGNYLLFTAASAAAKDQIAAWKTTQPTGITSQNMDTLTTNLKAVTDAVDAAFDNFQKLQTEYTTVYQPARKTCFEALLKAEAAGYCTACVDSADLGNYGIVLDSSTPKKVTAFPLATSLEKSLAVACIPYFQASESQNAIIKAHTYAAKLGAMKDDLIKIAAKDSSGVTSFNTDSVAATPAIPLTKTPASGCDTTNGCAATVDLMIPLAKVDQTASQAIYGGVAARRMLEQARLLQTGSALVNADGEVKYTITVKSDPSGMGNPNSLSALRVGVVSCIVAFFVALLI